MPKFLPEMIRTVALVGHGAAGKTTLAEALLHRAGAIAAAGSVERGTTVCDFDALEKSYQHSLNASFVHLASGETRIHLIDTPGLPDFVGRAIGALPAVETAAVVINAQNGIEMITQRMMQWAAKRNLCRMIVVNKIDAENVDLPQLVSQIQAAFGKECLPINLPADGGKRVVDCFFNPSGEADFSSVEEAHQALIDQVVEVDEELMAKYLEQGEVSPAELHAPFEQALREGHLVPICFVSARTGAGVPELLDIFVKLMPNPTEGNPPQFLKGEGAAAEPIHALPDPSKHVLAHVFKVMIDPFVGKVGVFRVHQGTITRDTQLFIGDGRKPFKVGHPYLLQGKEFVEADALVPGDIGAVAKVDEIHFDAVLHDSHDEDHIHLAPLEFPTPMHSLAIEPKRRGDEQRISEAMHKLAAEDPTFKVAHTAAAETVISGLGDLHMRYILDRLQAQYHVEVTTKPPRIPYRETITAKAEGHHRHKKQTGGAGQFGEVFLRVEPLARGTGFRVRGRGERRRHPVAVHARGRKGRAPGARRRPDRRISGAGCACDRLRRQTPRGGFEGGRLHLGGQTCVHGCDRQGPSDRARADRQSGDQCARAEHGRHRRRYFLQARPDQWHRFSRTRHRGNTGAGPARRAQQLPGAAEVRHGGPGIVLGRALSLRARSAERPEGLGGAPQQDCSGRGRVTGGGR